MSKLYSVIGAVAFGGAFAYLGYMLLVGTPVSSGSRRGRLFDDIQNWIISYLGETGTGALFIVIGVLGGLYFLRSAFSDN